MTKFYVYEHWRPDKQACFYVGKGHGKRAYDFNSARNRHYKNVVAKLNRMGMKVDVRFVANQLDENEAFEIEKQQIIVWRNAGAPLTNLTSGGEGITGYVWSKELKRKHSIIIKNMKARPEMKIMYSKAIKIGLAQSIKFKESMSSAEFRNKQSILRKKVWARPEGRKKYLITLRKANARPEVKVRRSVAQKIFWNSEEAKQQRRIYLNRPEVKAKHSASLKAAYAKPEWKAAQSARIKASWIKRREAQL